MVTTGNIPGGRLSTGSNRSTRSSLHPRTFFFCAGFFRALPSLLPPFPGVPCADNDGLGLDDDCRDANRGNPIAIIGATAQASTTTNEARRMYVCRTAKNRRFTQQSMYTHILQCMPRTLLMSDPRGAPPRNTGARAS